MDSHSSTYKQREDVSNGLTRVGKEAQRLNNVASGVALIRIGRRSL